MIPGCGMFQQTWWNVTARNTRCLSLPGEMGATIMLVWCPCCLQSPCTGGARWSLLSPQQQTSPISAAARTLVMEGSAPWDWRSHGIGTGKWGITSMFLLADRKHPKQYCQLEVLCSFHTNPRCRAACLALQ